MEITLEQLSNVVARAVDTGMQIHLRSMEPESDRITQAQAKRYVKRLGYKPVMIDKWRKAKLIKGKKSGTQQSDTVYYSLVELKKLITTLQLGCLIGQETSFH